MAITLQKLPPSKSSNVHTEGYSTRQPSAIYDNREVQYRQLVSRAVTQRLHSPSLDDLTKPNVADKLTCPLKAWEMQERFIARDKARIEAEMLDVPWTQFIRDVERAALEVHVLTPTRYGEPSRDKMKNQEASKRNKEAAYIFGASGDLDQDKEWKKKDAAIYNMLRAFQGGRSDG